MPTDVEAARAAQLRAWESYCLKCFVESQKALTERKLSQN